MILGVFSISVSGQDEPDYSKNDPDKTAILYNNTKDIPLTPVEESIDSLKIALKNLREACSNLIDITAGRTNTYQGMVKDAKKIKKKIEQSKLYKKINNTETVKGFKKDIDILKGEKKSL